MKGFVLAIAIIICASQTFYSQEDDGVVALALPIRNSLTFNQYAINPTFSFVRQQNAYVSFTNKREWVQFEDAPQTYLASYSGRFRENIGLGVGLFQQNYGVLTTFGGLLNFAYNARLQRDSNLTFGLNIGAYKSGINSGNVVTNFADPSLENIPSNFLLTVNPGINYGTAFMDFGVSVNNLVLYNLNSSELITENSEQSIQAHIMYTGYMNGSGFFDESKFSTLLRSEFQQDQTIISGLAMVTVPKGIWAQVGYNSLYGASGGLGLNITKEIAIEYNFEKALGDLTDFGPSHEITLAYRFKNNENYDYSSEDEISGLIGGDKRRKPVSSISKAKAEENRKLAAESKAQAKLDAEARAVAKAEEEAKAKLDAQLQAELEAEAKKEAQLKAESDMLAKAEQDLKNKKIADEKAAIEAEVSRIAAEKQANEVAQAKAKIAAENKKKAEAAAQEKTRLDNIAMAEAKAKADADAKLAENNRIKAEAERTSKLAEEARLKAETEAKEAAAKLAEEARLKNEAEAVAQLEAEKRADEAASAAAAKLEEQTKLELEVKSQAELEAKAILAAEAQLKLEADKKAREEAEAKIAAEEKAISEKEVTDGLNSVPTDAIAQSMSSVEKLTKESEAKQTELLKKYQDAIAIKNRDLKDLKEENDLSEQGIVMAPKPFKSITEENNALAALNFDLDEIIDIRNDRIKELETLYEERFKIVPLVNDEVNLYYQKAIKKLKSEQAQAMQTKANLVSTLKDINVATEIERKRRIKRAAFDSQEDRYQQDRNALSIIKQNTKLSSTALKESDFDFGEEQSSNIQILKNVKNIDNGYYVVIAVHNEVDKRNEFITKVVASGRTDIDFFYDVNTSKYYIYYDKFENIDEANEALKSKGDRPYNGKMSLVKIEN